MKWKNPQQKVRVLSLIVFFLVFSIAYWVIPGKDTRDTPHFIYCELAALVIGFPIALWLSKKYNPDWKKLDKKEVFFVCFIFVLFLIPFLLCEFFA